MSSTSTPATPTRTWLPLAVVLTTQMMIVLDSAIVNIALPDMQQALHIAPADLSWVVNAYTLAFGGLLLLGARAGDLFGRRPVFAVGMALFTVASLLGGFAGAGSHLFLARAAQGVGAALVAPSALAILMGLYPEARDRTRAIGYYTIVSASGAAIGLIAGGVLTSFASWRWVMFVNVPIGLVVLVLSRRALPASRSQHGRIDVLGSLLSTVGMTALVYGFISAAADGWRSAGAVGSFVASVVLLGTFVVVERRVAQPVVPLHLFADRERVGAYTARLLLVAGSLGAFFFLSQYFQLVLGWSPVRTGMAFVPFPVSVFISSQLATRLLVPRFGGRVVIIVGMSMSVLGLALLSTVDVHTGYAQLVASMVVFALGNGTAFVPLTEAGMVRVAPHEAGVASGLVNVTQQLGGAVGLAVLVTVFASAGPGAASGPGATAAAKELFVVGADRGFAVAAALIAVAVVLVLGLSARRRTPQPVRVRTEGAVLEPAA
jgi:EmrB/QacA subfamily drug resistance transporter